MVSLGLHKTENRVNIFIKTSVNEKNNKLPPPKPTFTCLNFMYINTNEKQMICDFWVYVCGAIFNLSTQPGQFLHYLLQ